MGSLISASGLALLYGALDQGERLYWLNSGVIVAMLVAGVFLLAAALVRRIVQPNPILNLAFLNTAEHHHPGLIDFRV